LIKNFYNKLRFGAPIIVVSGLPRSGTSMMMKMLDAAGLKVVSDAVRAADEDNPKGYFEDERVKALGESEDRSWLRDCRGRVIKIISFLLTDLPEDNFYKIIFMRRNFEEVLASQNKMLVRRGEANPTADEKMIGNYKWHLKKVDYLLEEQSNFDALDVDYRKALESPREYAERVARFLGMKLDVDKMAAVVDPALYRNRAEGSSS